MAAPMKRFAIAFAVLTLLVTACDASAVGPGSSPAHNTGSSEYSPAPNAFIPKDPSRLAHVLAKTTYALQASIQRWTTNGDTSRGKPPLDLRLQALYQQR